MSLNQYSKEELKEMSFIEIAYELLNEKKQAVPFKDIVDEVSQLLGLSEEEVRAKLAQFYTDMNIDGRFISLGENRWGLRVWYPIDQTEDETITTVKPKKKKAKKALDDDLDVDDYDDIDEDEIDYDDIDAFEEDEDEDLLDDDLIDEDLDALDEDDDESDIIDDEDDYDLDEEEELLDDELEDLEDEEDL
ncbi:DNA-directed RNA polymerase subunit delta [Bacillus methanolicus]|uniref:DNA-directed RNA polymerase subunit delta n=1 Tax=Bacillus methanolicus TaxID=1471 RepID=UPI002380C0F4|nr:DNA-directed RNA polymerase subunit delta [Bacillus methanolicus]MDE3840345.1 DNA-directed RNA polymerase subunit delta [Bacillus methanolicus]